MFAGRLPVPPHPSEAVCLSLRPATPGPLGLASPGHLLEIAPVSPVQECVFFPPPAFSFGVSLTAGIKEPLHTGCAAYLRQQPCQWDYFKWELESNCRRGFGRTLAVSYYTPVPWRVAGKREGFPRRPPADADGTVSPSGCNLALSRFQ